MRQQPLILLVDDEPDVLSLYSTKLLRAEYAVTTATNGKEAILSATEYLPDLIIMDIKMPIMDGVTALHELKENPKTKDLKVIFFTSFSDPTNQLSIQNEIDTKQAVGILKKGESLDDFIKGVQGYLQ